MRKRFLLELLRAARKSLQLGNIRHARTALACFRSQYNLVPASTKLRWRCGR